MSKKSKTQRAKASASRQARKVQADVLDSASNGQETSVKAAQSNSAAKHAKQKTKKTRFKFLKEVKAELKRVTWPSRDEVLRWTVVVVVALVFFGVFVAVLDNVIVTPFIVAVSGIAVGA